MAGVQAGRLSIEIVAEVARLTQDLQKVKSLVSSASGDIARSAKAANDNLSSIGKGAGAGVQQFSRDVAQLKAALDPAWAAQRRFNEAQQLGVSALKAGAISREQFITHMRQINAELKGIPTAAQAAAAATEREAKALRDAALAAQEAAQQQALYAGQAANLRAQLDPMFSAQQRFNQAMDQADDLLKAGAITAREYASAQQMARDNLQRSAQAITGNSQLLQRQAKISGEAKQGMQQLSFQLNDVATQFASGTPPMQIFAQQAGQTVQAVQLMVGGTSKLATFLSGPWGMAVVAATVVLVPFIAKLFETKAAADSARGALDRLMEARAQEVQQQSELARSGAALVELEEKRAKLQEYIARQPKDARGNPMFSYKQQKELADLEMQILTAQDARGAKERADAAERNREISQEIEDRSKLAGAISKGDQAQALYTQRVREAKKAWDEGNKGIVAQRQYEEALTKAETDLNVAQQKTNKTGQARIERLQREAVAIETLTRGLYAVADAYGRSEAEAMRLEITAKATEQGIKKRAELEGYVSREMAKALAQRSVDAAKQVADLNAQAKAQEFVNAQVKAGVLDAQNAADALSFINERRATETALAAAQSENDKDAIEALTKALRGLEQAQLRTNRALREAADIQKAADIREQIDGIVLETKLTKQLGEARLRALRGYRGDALENELARIATEHEKISIQARAEAQAADLVKRGYNEAAAAVLRKAEADKTQVEATAEIERQIRALDQLNQRVSDSIGLIGSLPGFGSFGSELSNVLGRLNDTNFGSKFLRNMEGTLDKFFGGDGAFNEALGAFGVAVSANQLIGDIVGFKGGPLGIFTSLVESIFKKDKYGSSVVTASGVSLRGNNNDAKSGADSLGNALNTSLQNLAKMLNTTLGQFAVSIGVTNGKINVNPGTVNGKIGTTFQRDTIDFGKDEAGALKWAIQNAIEDGAFAGLSEGVKKFLTSGDVEQQIQRYMNLQSAFEELSSLKDPQGYALTQLDKAFTELRATATEAGEDLARVEELYGLKRAEIVEKYSAEIASVEDKRALQIQILELEGNTIAALTMARQAEKDAADASLHSLLDRRNALQDEAQAAQEAAASLAEKLAADDRILALQIRLSRAQGNEETAKALERMQELTGARTDEERAMLMQIHAIDKAMEAQEKLAGGFATTADIINRITSETYEMTKSLREFADSIFGREELADPTAQYQELIEKAALGDKAALAKLPDAINAYLGQAQGMSSSLADYQIAAAYARQAAYGVADVADSRARFRAVGAAYSQPGGEGLAQSFENAFKDMQRELAELRATVAKGNEDRVNLSLEQLYATKQGNQLLDDVTLGGSGMVLAEEAA